MQSIDGRPVYAATDLVAFLACGHLTQLERASLAGLVKRPMRDDPELDIIRKRQSLLYVQALKFLQTKASPGKAGAGKRGKG